MTTGPEHRVPLQGAESQVNVVAESSDDGSYEIRVERGTTGEFDASTRTPTRRLADGESDTTGVPARMIAAGISAAVVVLVLVAMAFGGDAEPEPDPVAESPAALETPVREFQVFQIRDPAAPTLPGFAIGRDIGLGAGDAGSDIGVVEEPDAEGVGDDEPSTDPFEDRAQPELPVLDPLTVDRLRNVRIELQPDDPIRAPDEALPEDLRNIEFVLPDETAESPGDDE